MRTGYVSSFAAVALVAACTEPVESTATSTLVSSNRIFANGIAINRLKLGQLSLDQLAISQLNGTQQLNVSDEKLLSDTGTREVLSLIVSCAMPLGITLTATSGDVDYEFPGEVGLAPNWLLRPLEAVDQRWVSACMFARVNANAVVVPVSLRASHPALRTSADERAAWTVEEGAFYGNFFADPSQPLSWYACRGAGQAAGEFGGLIDRDCTEPDPDHPGQTLCGFTYAGDCGAFAADYTCESYSPAGTFYRACHSAPITDRKPSPDYPVFVEVITAFVLP